MHTDDARPDAVQGAGEPTLRAQELRATLTARREVETLLVQASTARQEAVADADAMLAEAEQVSAQLVADSRREAEQLTVQARTDAQAIRSRAESEVEEHRRRARAEIAEQVGRDVRAEAAAELVAVREQSAAMIGDLEASVRILGVALQSAQATVGELLSALGDLRLHTGEAPGPGSNPDLATEYAAEQTAEQTGEQTREETLGAEADDAPPRTALEAYLRAAHLDHDDPPLPPMDDSEVGARYARDAAARADRPDETTPVDPAPVDPGPVDPGPNEPPPRSDKPLGWLFRSAP